MASSVPVLLVPGLLCSARLYAPQIPALWPFGQVAVADHRRDTDMAAIAARILEDAPPRFALAGLSMGGYIAFAMLRLAPSASSGWRCSTPRRVRTRRSRPPGARRRSKWRKPAGSVRFRSVDPALPASQSPARPTTDGDRAANGARDGAGCFCAPAKRDHDAAGFAAAVGEHCLPDAGAGRQRRCCDAAGAQPRNRRRDFGREARVVPDCGHLSTLEKPEAVNAALSDWLRA